MFGYYVQHDPTSEHPMEIWEVVTDDDQTIYVWTNGNGGFGPVNVWTGDRWLGGKYRQKKRDATE